LNDEINAAIREAARRGRFTLDAFTGELLDAPPDVIEQPDPAPPRTGDWDGGQRGPSSYTSPSAGDMNALLRKGVARQRGF
jgi:hypothetical protein